MFSMTIVGKLGADPELRFADSGTPVLSLSVASNRREKKDNEWVSVPTWIKVSFWGKRAESIAPHLSKGSSVAIRGEGYTTKYTGRDGVERQALECRADDVEFAGPKADNGGAAGQSAAQRPAAGARGARQDPGAYQTPDDETAPPDYGDIPF